jgi:hypothetical protein
MGDINSAIGGGNNKEMGDNNSEMGTTTDGTREMGGGGNSNTIETRMGAIATTQLKHAWGDGNNAMMGKGATTTNQ